VIDPASNDDDLPIIDVRSPAERWTDSGRSGLERVQQRLRDNHLDIAALIWMICVAGVLAVEVYGAVGSNGFDAFPGGDNGWVTATLLASSGGYVLAFGCMIGIALAAWVDSVPARVALVMAAVGGVWAMVANLIGIAVVFHRQFGVSLLLSNFADNRAVAAFGVLMQGGFGVVIVLVATSVLTSRREKLPPDPEIAELS
jgi:hypothetical protein